MAKGIAGNADTAIGATGQFGSLVNEPSFQSSMHSLPDLALAFVHCLPIHDDLQSRAKCSAQFALQITID